MSYPFGGHPKFGHFKRWARENEIEVQDGVVELNGRSIKVTTFVTADGVRVPVANILDGEFMVPSLVARLERRLNVLSPFASLGKPN